MNKGNVFPRDDVIWILFYVFENPICCFFLLDFCFCLLCYGELDGHAVKFSLTQTYHINYFSKAPKFWRISLHFPNQGKTVTLVLLGIPDFKNCAMTNVEFESIILNPFNSARTNPILVYFFSQFWHWLSTKRHCWLA